MQFVTVCICFHHFNPSTQLRNILFISSHFHFIYIVSVMNPVKLKRELQSSDIPLTVTLMSALGAIIANKKI